MSTIPEVDGDTNSVGQADHALNISSGAAQDVSPLIALSFRIIDLNTHKRYIAKEHLWDV